MNGKEKIINDALKYYKFSLYSIIRLKDFFFLFLMFRTKEKKRVYTKNKKTLDAKHKEKVKYFKDLTIIIKEKEDKINILEKQLKKLEENREEIGNIIKIINIRDEICNQKKQLKDINNRDEENDYYLKNGELLFEYYNNKNKKVKTEQIIGKNTKSVLDFFGHREKKETFINDDDNKCRRIKYTMNILQILRIFMLIIKFLMKKK